MTSHRDTLREEHSIDELDSLIRCALRESSRFAQAQPPAYVWTEIKRRAKQYMAGRARRPARLDVFYQPTNLSSVWESSISFSLACIIEQQMPMLRGIGWAT